MPHYGLLKDYRLEATAADDIRGAKIYGRSDEKLGTVDDVVFDHSTATIRYVVVDAGGWFSSKKFLVPPHRLHTRDGHDEDFSVNLAKETIEGLPRYQESDLESHDRWQACEKRFDEAWHAGPVLHRHGSDRSVTPTSTEMPPEPGSIGSQLTDDERVAISSRIIPPLANEATIQANASGIGDRWSTFAERLRQHRRKITKACKTCTVEPVSDRTSENPRE